MSDKNEFGTFIMGFTIGALAGAVVSLLMAPQTGEETRQLIKDRAIELKEKGAESYEETKRKAEIAYKDAVAKYEQFAETTKEKAAEFGQQVKTKVEEIVHPAEKAVTELKEGPEEA